MMGNNEYSSISEYTFHSKLYEITGNRTISEFQSIIRPVMEFVKSKFKDLLAPINDEIKRETWLLTMICCVYWKRRMLMDLEKRWKSILWFIKYYWGK